MREKIVMSWSGGKDSAMALYEIMKSGKYEVVSLLTTITEGYNRITMHGVRLELLESQGRMIGYPIDKVYMPQRVSGKEHERRMKNVLAGYLAKGIKTVAFGDIFLEDVRRYRENNLAKIDMNGLFPLWNRDTYMLGKNFIDLGFKAVITAVDSKFLDESFVCREYDERFLRDLPDNVDPCGENGEFHSFVYDGPIFKRRVQFEKGDVVFRENRFYFCDLVPHNTEKL